MWALQYLLDRFHHVLRSETEKLEEVGRWSRLAVAVYAHNCPFEPDIFAPVIADARLHRNTWNAAGQYALAIRGVLPIFRVIGCRISRSEARQRSPSRMVFTPVEQPTDRTGREIVRETVIPAMLLCEIAELFPPLPPREPENELERQLAAAFGADPGNIAHPS